MKRETVGEIIFWGVFVFALLLYAVSAPDGLPWGASMLTNRIWVYFVEMFNGHTLALSCTAAAVAGGLIGTMANSYFGWRIGCACALVWVFLPGVWNRVVLGAPSIGFAAAIVVAAWVANAVVLFVIRRSGENPFAIDSDSLRGRINRIASWALLCLAVLFAIVSALSHDYRLGEAASAYARTIIEEAGDRVIVLNGLCDEQIEREVGWRRPVVSFKNAEANRSNFVAWVKRAFPSQTNLWFAAQVSPNAFAEQAVPLFPERLYAMNGSSTTPEQWAARWKAMAPYLASRDPFIVAMRRAFAYEGNYLGNILQEKGDKKAAWELYLRIFDEVHPRNPAACVNLNEMLRRGYVIDEPTRMRIESAQADYAKMLADKNKAMRVAERIATFGPVMRDQKVYDELQKKIAERLAEMQKQGVSLKITPELKTLVEWHGEMMEAFNAHELVKAAHLARAILSRPRWQGFIPAHMVMGAALAQEGDYLASEAFYRVAMTGKGSSAPLPFIYNDYADVLRNLKRYDEAEKMARDGIAKSGETDWLCRLTLAQILRDAGKNKEEVDSLVSFALKYAPKDVGRMITQEFLKK